MKILSKLFTSDSYNALTRLSRYGMVRGTSFAVDSGYKGIMGKLLSYPVLFSLAILEIVIACSLSGTVREAFDTASYISAADNLQNGHLDLLRTPVYPFFIWLFRIVFGSTWQIALVILQFGAILLSAVYLKKIADRYIANPKITFWVVAAYLLWPICLIYYSRQLVTEAFAIAGVVYWVWSLAKTDFRSPNPAAPLLSFFWLTFLIFLRPVFLYLLPAAFIYYIVAGARMKWKNSRFYAVGLSLTALVCALIGLYRYELHREYGINSFTTVTSINNYFTVREAGLRNPDIIKDEALKAIISQTPRTVNPEDANTEIYLEFWKINDLNKPVEFEAYVQDMMRDNPEAVSRVMWDRLTKKMPRAMMISVPSDAANRFMPKFALYWILTGIAFAIFAIQWVKTKRFPLTTFVLGWVTVGLVVTSGIAAMGEFDRLVYPGNSALLLLTGYSVKGILSLCGRE